MTVSPANVMPRHAVADSQNKDLVSVGWRKPPCHSGVD